MLNRLRTNSTYYEDLFLDRYDWLFSLALQLTDHDLQQAEDLVHDVFVKFALTRPDLQRIENLDGYLYTALRNTYRSQLRRAGRGLTQQLSLLDFDSLELGLRFVDTRNLIQVQDELFLICRYACWRKETAKAGSVLLLRYFLGYFPAEIASILRSERHLIAELLRTARAEARLIVQEPHRLGFVGQSSTPQPGLLHAQLTTDGLVTALWSQIFREGSGECPPHAELQQIYEKTEGQPVDRRLLAHLVSCRRCLDEVNRTLGLPLLADRNPLDFTGPDPGAKGNSGSNGLKKGGRRRKSSDNERNEALKRFRRRVKSVYHHDPKELRIAVNGQWLGAQEIGAELNKQTLSLNESEPIGFIEIYSEQEVRLAYLVIAEPPDGEIEQEEIVELSDGRRIEISLSFKDLRPALSVAYFNPLMRPASIPSITSPETEDVIIPEESPKSPNRWWDRLRWILAMPQSAVALGLILLALWLAADHFKGFNKPSAANLLSQAATAEASSEKSNDQAIHRILEIEELGPDGTVVARRRVEVWRNAGKQVRRLYDEHDLLLASEWQTMNGATKLYRRKDESARTPFANQGNANWRAANRAPHIDELWRLELSARGFIGFAGNSDRATVAEKQDEYIISYRNPSPGLVEASLTLSRSRLHPIELLFHFRYANEDRVLHFSEKVFEPKSMKEIGGRVFETDPELIEVSAIDKSRSSSEQTSSNRQTSNPSATTTAMANLEIETLMLLHKISADLGEEVSLTRSADGKLKVEATVETEKRRAEILGAIAPIANNPAVLIRIETVVEALKRRSSLKRPRLPNPLEIQEYAATGSTIPAQIELHAHFAGKLAEQLSTMSAAEGEKAIEAETQQFAGSILKRSQKALLRAYALKNLTIRFTPAEVLNSGIRAEWLSLVDEHSRMFADEIGDMRVQLQAVIGAAEPDGENQVKDEIKGIADLFGAIDRLFNLAMANDKAVRSTFAIPTHSTRGSSVKMTQLWRSLIDAERLSQRIQKEAAGKI